MDPKFFNMMGSFCEGFDHGKINEFQPKCLKTCAEKLLKTSYSHLTNFGNQLNFIVIRISTLIRAFIDS